MGADKETVEQIYKSNDKEIGRSLDCLTEIFGAQENKKNEILNAE